MLILTLIAVFGLCLGAFNYFFQRDRYNRMTKQESEKLNPMNSPGAWLTYSILFFLVLLSVIGYYTYELMQSIMRMK